MSEHLKKNGFIMITLDSELINIGCRQIKPYTKLPLKDIIPSEVPRVFEPINNNINEAYKEMLLLKKYNFTHDGMSEREKSETGTTIHQAAEIIDPNIEPSMSYGLFVPSYQEELNLQKNKYGSPRYHSLLIGALTANTAIEYTATVKSVFPEAQTRIIDLETVKKNDKPGFIFADGLNTPFVKNTFSSIHTNYLFHMLEGENTESIKNIKRLFIESFRILNNEGKLIMCEGNLSHILGVDDNSAIQKIKQLLADSGFSDIEIKPAIKFKDRREMTKYFRSTDGLKEIITEKSDASMIIATKQDQKLKDSVIYI